MPKRSYKVVKRNKQKWAPVCVPWTPDQNYVLGLGSSSFHYVTICANDTHTAVAPTATIIKCGNFKTNFSITYGTGFAGLGSILFRLVIIYVPQGYTSITEDLLSKHPEWIIAWTQFSPINGTTVTFGSKLKRNLNSGDEILLGYIGWNDSTADFPFKVKANTTYVVRNN